MRIKFITWHCKKCNEDYDLEVEEDENTTKMWCPLCHRQLRRKNEKE